MATLWLASIILSIVLTLMVVSTFRLKQAPYLALLNVLCPFAGLLYALYVVHVIIPKVAKKQTGQKIESPLMPYIRRAIAWLKKKIEDLQASNNNRRLK